MGWYGGVTGLVVPPSDAVALKQAMKFLWQNPAVATQMGKEAAKRYVGSFTAKQMAQSYAQVYRDFA